MYNFMEIVKKRESINFRVYVKDEKTKETISAGILDDGNLTKEHILDLVIHCLQKHKN
jgi:hypothetical protein